MVQGPAGLLACHPNDYRPAYQKTNRSVTWPNGAVGLLFNGVEPDQLRGPQHDVAWADELAKWRYSQEAWDMLQFGLRLGEAPQQIVTTTPRPIPVIRELLKSKDTAITKGITRDNFINLAGTFLTAIETRYQGTRLGRQELNAEILDDAPDALWTRRNLDENRKTAKQAPDLKRIVVAIDPATKTNEMQEDGAATGIVVAGIGIDGRGYVLDDATCRASPDKWARIAVAAYDRFNADCIVAETNQGGDMVREVLRSVRPGVPFREVVASRGKWTRAEPVAALYEQNRVSHCGIFAALEDEMVIFGPNGMADGMSPDRVDALVWALTSLFPQITQKVAQMQAPVRMTDPLASYRVPTRRVWGR